MVVETFRTSGSEACALTVQDNVNGVAVEWSFQLECPARLVLAFLNEDYESFTKEDPPTDEQAWYLRGAFAKGNGALLREMVDHVLVCREERGFDPITRLAAYSFAHELFDLSRVASYAERVSLEASVVGTKAMASMTAGWSGILSAHKAQPLAQRSDLFEALVLDAAEKGYAFELSLSQEHSSLSQLLKSFVVEMIRTRVLLGRCPGCGQYFLAAEGSDCNCANKSADLPPVNPGKGDGPASSTGRSTRPWRRRPGAARTSRPGRPSTASPSRPGSGARRSSLPRPRRTTSSNGWKARSRNNPLRKEG